jgi:hypothetical protein
VVFSQGPVLVLPGDAIESISTVTERSVERIISVRIRVPEQDASLGAATSIRVRPSDADADARLSACRPLETWPGEVCQAPLRGGLSVTVLMAFATPPSREALLATAKDYVESRRARCER